MRASVREKTPEKHADDMIQEAERAKANIFPQQGESNRFSPPVFKIDQDYMAVEAHLDEGIKRKIVQGEYVDFGRLIPNDRVVAEEDNRMELIVKNGKVFWSPVASMESTVINGFSKWEQAFRIFSDVYTRAYPDRASELIQYNHLIHTISLSYTWENVYGYDKEFRLHISRHPDHSWAIILQQAWTMRLKDRLKHDNQGHWVSPSGHTGSVSNGNRNNETCRHFNREVQFWNSLPI